MDAKEMAELKGALERAQKAEHDFKAQNDQAIAERKEHGRVLADTQEKVAKVEAALDAKVEAAQKRWDEIERRANRGELFGGASDKAEAKALEVAAFNRRLSLMGGPVARKPLSPEAYFGLYKPAFLTFLRGNLQAVEHMAPEYRAALSVGSDPNGGYQAPPDITDRVVELVYESSPIRRRAAARRTSRDRITLHRDLDEATLGGWVSETGTRSTSATPQTPVPHEIPVHEQFAFPLITQQDIEDSEMDLEAWLVKKLAAKFARVENTAFVSGNGIGKPRGFLAYTAGTPSKATYDRIQQVNTGGAAGFAASPNGPDIFVDLMGAMKEEYLDGSSWAMTRTTLSVARKLKDSEGQYQVQLSQGLQGRPGFEILGFPVDRFADMPELAASALSIALANWAEAYQVVDHASGMTVLRDPFTQKPHVGVYAKKRVGGDVANTEAIKLAKCSA
jgi:HK97 family phage major capsid protein